MCVWYLQTSRDGQTFDKLNMQMVLYNETGRFRRMSAGYDWPTEWCCLIATGPRQHSDSWFRVPRDHILLSDGSGSLQTTDSYSDSQDTKNGLWNIHYIEDWGVEINTRLGLHTLHADTSWVVACSVPGIWYSSRRPGFPMSWKIL
jgi:hypothetical protein